MRKKRLSPIRVPTRPGDERVSQALHTEMAIAALRRAEKLLTAQGLKLLASDGKVLVVRGITAREPIAVVFMDIETR